MRGLLDVIRVDRMPCLWVPNRLDARCCTGWAAVVCCVTGEGTFAVWKLAGAN